MAHVLVVGGTGMLKEVSLFLAGHDNTVSVVARTEDNLHALQVEAEEAKGKGKINPLQLDYRNKETLQTALEEAVETFGPISLAVNWMHSNCIKSARIIAEILNGSSPFCRYFQILPSIEGDSESDLAYYNDPFTDLIKVLYRKIILGFVVDKGMSRWLTNGEISEGVIKALRGDQHNVIIGTLEPGGSRPQTA